jgi:predicted metal-dependent enzyme (double-stranded beta helix superfamily)
VETSAGLDACGKLSPPQGLDPRTVQLVANRYTDYTISVHEFTNKKKLKQLYEEEYEEKGKHEGNEERIMEEEK